MPDAHTRCQIALDLVDANRVPGIPDMADVPTEYQGVLDMADAPTWCSYHDWCTYLV